MVRMEIEIKEYETKIPKKRRYEIIQIEQYHEVFSLLNRLF